MDSMLLNANTWDITVDASGNMAAATGGYAIAQDVASVCRTFLGEPWYNTTLGIPYFSQILGRLPPLGFIAALLAAAGETVPGVQSIAVQLFPVTSNRVLDFPVAGKLTITNTPQQQAVIQSAAGVPWYVVAVGGQNYGTL